jgi:hypothetical protein
MDNAGAVETVEVAQVIVKDVQLLVKEAAWAIVIVAVQDLVKAVALDAEDVQVVKVVVIAGEIVMVVVLALVTLVAVAVLDVMVAQILVQGLALAHVLVVLARAMVVLAHVLVVVLVVQDLVQVHVQEAITKLVKKEDNNDKQIFKTFNANCRN